MRSLRRLASSGRSIVATIHQPRSATYAMVDALLLVAVGRVASYGPATGAVTRFARLGVRGPPRFNPADFLIDTTAVPSAPVVATASAIARIHHLARHAHAADAPSSQASEAVGVVGAAGAAGMEEGFGSGGGDATPQRVPSKRDTYGQRHSGRSTPRPSQQEDPPCIPTYHPQPFSQTNAPST